MSKKTWSELVQSQSSDVPSLNQSSSTTTESQQQQQQPSISFDDIMSEQLALDLSVNQSNDSYDDCQQQQQNSNEDPVTADAKAWTSLKNDENNDELDCSNDEMLARLLQHELDLEHDRMLKREERQYNANSKVQISFEKLRRLRNEDLDDSDDLDDQIHHHEYGQESKHWDFYEQKERQAPKIGKQGYVVDKNGEVTTKHDLEMNKCRNACKVMEFESDILTGDGAAGVYPMKLSNSVYNVLKNHSISEGKRMARLHEKKEKSSAEKAVDAKSRILLFKMINNGTLDTMNGVIATGKESVVIHGIGQNLDKNITIGEVAIKIFKTTITEFRERIQYIIGDPILEQTGKLSKQNPKLTIPLWAEKEMHNLNRLRKFGILCPEVVLLKKHILIMTFIGRDGRPAPTIKNLIYSDELFQKIWQETEKLMIRLYRECDMIHADLSEYNLLWHENKLWCIDVSQAVRTTHPMAFRFLWRDCVNICKFFSKKLCDLKSPHKLFEMITGKAINEFDDDNAVVIELFDKMENYEKNRNKNNFERFNDEESMNNNGKGRCEMDFFDELFEKALKENQCSTGVA